MIVSFSQFTTPGLDGKNEALRVTVPTTEGAQRQRWRCHIFHAIHASKTLPFLEHRTVLDKVFQLPHLWAKEVRAQKTPSLTLFLLGWLLTLCRLVKMTAGLYEILCCS